MERISDYEPLDISRLCNAGPEVLGDGTPAEIGEQRFRGLPFLVGDGSGGDCFISLSVDVFRLDIDRVKLPSIFVESFQPIVEPQVRHPESQLFSDLEDILNIFIVHVVWRDGG